MTAIIDYNAGNLRSVQKALDYLGEPSVVTRDRDEILGAERVILPGVGNFGDAMGQLERLGLAEVIREVARRGIPLLGICLGLQLFFEESEESPGVPGLGLLPGRIQRIPDAPDRKVPHIGWNSLVMTPGARLFTDLPAEPYVYFVHSYYLEASDSSIVAATTEYGVVIHAAVESGSLFACQFHPEKSGRVGLRILQHFIEI